MTCNDEIWAKFGPYSCTLNVDEVEDVDSIGGLIAKHLGRVPIPGSTIIVPGWKLTAERPSGRRHRIATVLAERIAESGKATDQL